MYALDVSRKEFTALLAERKLQTPTPTSFRELSSRRISKGGAIAVWDERPKAPSELPQAFVVNDEELDEFLAYAATYVGGFFPFSSFFRVIVKSEIPLLPGREGIQSSDLTRGLVGATIAEAFAQSQGRISSVDRVGLPACFGTLYFPMAQLFSQGFDPFVTPIVRSRWDATRKMLGLSSHPMLNSELLLWTASVIWAAHSHQDAHEAAKFFGVEGVLPARRSRALCRTIEQYIRSGGRISSDLIAADLSDVPALLRAIDEHSELEPKEDQIREFSQLVAHVSDAPNESRRISEFAIAYILVTIGRGSIRYLPLATSVVARLPMVPIWFGYLSALYPGNDVMEAGGCLGRQIAKRLRPGDFSLSNLDADIGFYEFLMLHGDEMREVGFKTANANQLSLELAPGVIGRFRLKGESAETDRRVSPSFLSELRELEFLADRMQRSLKRLASGELQQRELFDKGVGYTPDDPHGKGRYRRK